MRIRECFDKRTDRDSGNHSRNRPGAFPTKSIKIALNPFTCIAHYLSGYRNVYELAPLWEVTSTKLTLADREAN